MSEKTWLFTDHVCRDCGGRILRCATGGGMSPGGNPLYRCADCGNARSDGGPQGVCWCGYETRANSEHAYQCLSFFGASDAELAALAECGCRPGRQEVGIVLRASLARARAAL